jgi:hypothetical protein
MAVVLFVGGLDCSSDGQSCIGGECVPLQAADAGRPDVGSDGDGDSEGDGGSEGDGASEADAGRSDAEAGGSNTVFDGGLGEFCRRFYEAIADHVALCGCTDASVQMWRTFGATSCGDPSGLVPRLEPAIRDGQLVYHPERVDALLAPLAGTASCYATWTDLGLDSATVLTMGGVFTGTGDVGNPCRILAGQKGGVHDCKEGLLCAANSAGAPRCATLVGMGEECDVGATPDRMCFERRPPDSDDEFESAFDLLVCIPSVDGGTTGTCRKNLDDGLLCHQGATCKSGHCVATGVGTGVCTAKAADGESCSNGAMCSSGACGRPGDASASVCTAPLADGAWCGYDDASCASGRCYAIDNQTTSKSPGVCGPKLDKPVGSSCSQGYECATGVCRANRCTEHICRK